MIALSAPLALLALLALPILVWMHRRRRRAVLVDVPSVLFLEAEAHEPAAPERVRIDAELLLALAAAAFLALAAAGPRVTSSSRGRVVRVVVDNGPAMGARSADGKTASDRAAAAWTGIRDLLGPDDRLDAFPGHGGPDGLLAAARSGVADLRVIVTDRRIVPAPPDVVVVAVGDPAAQNVGIVAANVEPFAGRNEYGVVSTRAFANVVNAGPDAARVRLRMFVGRFPGRAAVSERTLDVGPGGAASVVFERPEAAPDLVEFVLDPGDALPADDVATLDRRPFRVRFGTGANGYPDAYRRAVLEGLAAVVGKDLVEEPTSSAPSDGQGIDLYVGEIAGAPRGQGTAVLSLSPIEAGREGRRAARGRVRVDTFEATSPEVASIDATGCDLVFASAAPPEGGDALLETLPDRELSGWRFLPDPLAGTPAPVDHPLWPLFLDGLVARERPRKVAAGWRLSRGTLDPAVTRIGRDVVPFDPARLAHTVPSRRPKERDLRLLLLAAGTICLALLWLRPTAVARGRLP